MSDQKLERHTSALNQLLLEIVSEQQDAINRFGEITGQYHPLIISGKAAPKDIKKCSDIVQSINRAISRTHDLCALYNSVLQNGETLGEGFCRLVINAREYNG